MIAPANFLANPQTALSNAFQEVQPSKSVSEKARRECVDMADSLRAAGVEVLLFEDTAQPVKPDAVFPNNWFSTHADGQLLLYPMAVDNRRPERRIDIVSALSDDYALLVKKVTDFSGWESKQQFVEGTGSLVFDHLSRTAYAAWSGRTTPAVTQAVANHLGYRLVGFDTSGPRSRPVYHSNVMLSIGNEFIVVCAQAIVAAQRREILAELAATGRQIIEISVEQMQGFAGNLLELAAADGPIIALSRTALDVLDNRQLSDLSRHGLLLPMKVSEVERGGGSVRCMLAEIFLPLATAVNQSAIS